MELAQKKGDRSGSGSGSGSGPDSEDLEALLDGELAQKSGPGSGSGSGSGPDSEDLEALLDGELAQKKGEGSGPGSGPDFEDLEELADEIGSDLDLAQEEEGPKCPSKAKLEEMSAEEIFDLID